MSWLEKKAYKTLFACLLVFISVFLTFKSLNDSSENILPEPTSPNSQGILFAFVVLILGLYGIIYYFTEYKHFINELDERERLIYGNAKNISNAVFSGLWLITLSLVIALYDLDKTVPIYTLVYISITFWLLSDVIKSIIILHKLKRDRNDE